MDAFVDICRCIDLLQEVVVVVVIILKQLPLKVTRMRNPRVVSSFIDKSHFGVVEVECEIDYIDLSFATSQPKFLTTQVGKLWTVINTNKKQIATVCDNVNKIFNHCVDLVENKTTNYGR